MHLPKVLKKPLSRISFRLFFFFFISLFMDFANLNFGHFQKNFVFFFFLPKCISVEIKKNNKTILVINQKTSDFLLVTCSFIFFCLRLNYFVN